MTSGPQTHRKAASRAVNGSPVGGDTGPRLMSPQYPSGQDGDGGAMPQAARAAGPSDLSPASGSSQSSITIARHTPGPWFSGWGDGITGPRTARTLGWKQKWPVRCSGFHNVDHLVCALPYSLADAATIEADAHLISAAPELLEALEQLKKIAEAKGLRNHQHPWVQAAFSDADAAIAKARGDI